MNKYKLQIRDKKVECQDNLNYIETPYLETNLTKGPKPEDNTYYSQLSTIDISNIEINLNRDTYFLKKRIIKPRPHYDTTGIMGLVLDDETSSEGFKRIDYNQEEIDFDYNNNLYRYIYTDYINDKFYTFIHPVWVRTEVLENGYYEGKKCWWISDHELEGFHLHPAFYYKDGKLQEIGICAETRTEKCRLNVYGMSNLPFSTEVNSIIARLAMIELGSPANAINKASNYYHGIYNLSAKTCVGDGFTSSFHESNSSTTSSTAIYFDHTVYYFGHHTVDVVPGHLGDEYGLDDHLLSMHYSIGTNCLVGEFNANQAGHFDLGDYFLFEKPKKAIKSNPFGNVTQNCHNTGEYICTSVDSLFGMGYVVFGGEIITDPLWHKITTYSNDVTFRDVIFREAKEYTSIPLDKPPVDFNGKYRMSDIYPSTYQTITYLDIDTVESDNPGIESELVRSDSMFNGCKNLINIDNLDKLDMSKCVLTNDMFYGCTKLENIDLSNKNISKSVKSNGMFCNCSSLKTVNLSNVNLNRTNTLEDMFNGCTNLESVNLYNTNFNNSSDFSRMFKNCLQLTSIDFSNVNYGTGININEMFYGCTKLENINGLDLSHAIDLSNIFYGCKSLPNEFPIIIDLSYIESLEIHQMADKKALFENMFKESSVTKVTFKNANELTTYLLDSQLLKGDNTLEIVFIDTIMVPKKEFIYTDPSTGETYSGLYRYGYINEAKIKDYGYATNNQYELPIEIIEELTNIKPIGSAYQAFHYKFQGIENGLSNIERTWDTSEITDMSQMFSQFSTTKKDTYELKSYNWDTSKVTKMISTFEYCGLKNIEKSIENWDTSNVTNMASMFRSTSTLGNNEFPLLDTSKVTNMGQMFQGSSIKKLPNFDTHNVESFYSMFEACKNLTSIPQFDTSKGKNFAFMFAYCPMSIYPKKFPMIIDCSSITELATVDSYNGKNDPSISSLYEMFGQTGSTKNTITETVLTEVTFKNLREDLQKQLTSDHLTGGYFNGYYKPTVWITFMDNEGNITIRSGYRVVDLYGSTSARSLTTVDLLNMNSKRNGILTGLVSGDYLFNISSGQLTSITNLDKLNTSRMISMKNMFGGCYKVTSLDLSNFDMSKAKDVNEMFYGCSNLRNLNISELNTSNTTSMFRMFYNCQSLTNIPVIDTKESTCMYEMFYNCKALPSEFPWTIDCSGINTIYSYDNKDKTNIIYYGIQNIFKGSSVTKVNLKNVKEELKSKFTSQNLKGDDTLEITFID